MKSKKNIQSNLLLAMGFVLLLISGCNKEENTPEKVTDIDGNVYKTVKIGNQEWFAENLKTTKYRDGSAIPNITDNTAWSSQTAGAYCWYNNDATTYKSTYGALYNFYAVVSSRNLCPTGWHVPTDAEWTTLTNYLGGESVAGGKLKETGTTHWASPNTGATNETGFSALPGGRRNYFSGSFSIIGNYGLWWGSPEIGTNHAWSRYLSYDLGNVGRSINIEQNGFSVRCLRDL